MMDMEWLRRLIELVEESDIDTLEVSRLTTRVRISKSPPARAAPGTAAYPAAGSGSARADGGPSTLPAGAEGGAGAAATGPEGGAASDGLFEIKSPMVGTFYRAPAPDAPPYVEVGDRVSQGQTLCILEAMKLMNELESEVTGVIREIAVQNAEPVEYGQLLFRIETDGSG